jgi:hypothetical protein
MKVALYIAAVFAMLPLPPSRAGEPDARNAAARAVLPWCEIDARQNAFATRILQRAHAQRTAHPAPLAHVHTEGTLPHQGIRDASLAAERDWTIARDAAIAWRIGGEARYLAQADAYVAAWATTYEPDFNPIDETNLDALIDAYVLTQSALKPATRDAMRALLTRLAHGYVARMRPLDRPRSNSASNNWQSHRVKLVTLAAAALADDALLRTARGLFERQVAENILADGSVFDFHERDALHYVVYDLQPLVQAALAAKPFAIGGDWLSYESGEGASLGKALDWLRPYAEGRLSHEEFVHSRVAFDAERVRADVPGFRGAWDAKSSATLYSLAARLDARYANVARAVAAQPPDWIGICH